MCTAIVGRLTGALLLAGVRDEFVHRSWLPPARHWPDHPGLVGGRDELAGGTWLALDPAVPRVACVLNGEGPAVPPDLRRSRGELPLTLAETGTLEGDLSRFDPFHLIGGDLSAVRLWSWDGARLTERELGHGLHIVVNSGLAEPGARGDFMSARAGHFRPLFEAAGGDREAWLRVLDGDGLDAASDDRALVVRRDLDDRGVWGTTSISLTVLRPGGTAYDFTGEPGLPSAWRSVPTA